MSPDARPPGSRALARLFPPLSPETTTALAAYPAALRRALNLRPGLERQLPRSIRDLSLSLTAEREGGPKPGYLSDPRILSAYAWYFLPWNLLRLSRLLPALDLDLPEDGLVCDLGSGPLTFVQALWLSRPDLRRKKLRFLCVDRSRRALDLGLSLFTSLAGFDPAGDDAPWRIRLLRGEYWQGLADGADLVAMVNVANELGGTGREPLDSRMERLAAQLAESLAPGGRALVIEPGTRLGWRCLLGMREAFVEMGLGLLAPCPHGHDCPLTEGHTRAWCHFNMSLSGAPAWLSTLSERAELGKERLSLAFLLARKCPAVARPNAVRVVSGAFALADAPGSAVYGCSAKGLVVLVAPDGRPPRPGDLIEVAVPPDAPQDAKSGAPRVRLAGDPAAPAPGRPAAGRPDSKPAPSDRSGKSGRPDREGRPDKESRSDRDASGGGRGPRSSRQPSRPRRPNGADRPDPRRDRDARPGEAEEGEGRPRPARPARPARPPRPARPSGPSGSGQGGQGPARSGQGPREDRPKRPPARPAGKRNSGHGRPKGR
ncbi:Ribosomal small subunit Rsm22 [Solidesulfovibrio carbinoliphilus subsp. oakridgensis]|uniref:Ribosomal small subunit Rsm22 n=1 Tax=Solidesulfovibrio carbinoliphilus subsp. oakridgensis TaxID=694327 RepID=G7Q6B6_9BACT|nr:small ribosomal subunit Rsm22 family protein [Solidesulfovibrio carbinoliphilus]EHJ47289.1 Ribosomal small subunit Rsm22 [Solidesulfovibrio carbinoliphilus subsp. oakridgensis]